MLENKLQFVLTTDWHFGHKNMHKLCGRPEFFEDIIKRNLVVKVNSLTEDGHDIILVNLGDVCWSKESRDWAKQANSEINCTEKWLVKGNHDRLTNKQYMDMGFNSVQSCVNVRVNGSGFSGILFSHAQMKSDVFYNVHGHLHNNIPEKPEGILISQELLYYRPITLEEVLKIGATPKWDGEKFVSAYL